MQTSKSQFFFVVTQGRASRCRRYKVMQVGVVGTVVGGIGETKFKTIDISNKN